MDASDADPFRCHPDWEHNASVKNWMQFAELASCYLQSADALVNSALTDHTLLDVHVHAVCFLYRQGLELLLKDLAWTSLYLTTGEKRMAGRDWQEFGRHRLQELWKSGRENACRVLGLDFPLTTVATSQVGTLLAQFERHDPDSYSFRYPISKKKGITHRALTNVNLRVLRDRVGQAVEHVKHLVALIDWCYDQKSETGRTGGEQV